MVKIINVSIHHKAFVALSVRGKYTTCALDRLSDLLFKKELMRIYTIHQIENDTQ